MSKCLAGRHTSKKEEASADEDESDDVKKTKIDDLRGIRLFP